MDKACIHSSTLKVGLCFLPYMTSHSKIVHLPEVVVKGNLIGFLMLVPLLCLPASASLEENPI